MKRSRPTKTLLLAVSCRLALPLTCSSPFPLLWFCVSQVADLQKKIAAAVARLKQQQNLYEAVRSDRNVYSKNLIETQASISASSPAKTPTGCSSNTFVAHMFVALASLSSEMSGEISYCMGDALFPRLWRNVC